MVVPSAPTLNDVPIRRQVETAPADLGLTFNQLSCWIGEQAIKSIIQALWKVAQSMHILSVRPLIVVVAFWLMCRVRSWRTTPSIHCFTLFDKLVSHWINKRLLVLLIIWLKSSVEPKLCDTVVRFTESFGAWGFSLHENPPFSAGMITETNRACHLLCCYVYYVNFLCS